MRHQNSKPLTLEAEKTVYDVWLHAERGPAARRARGTPSLFPNIFGTRLFPHPYHYPSRWDDLAELFMGAKAEQRTLSGEEVQVAKANVVFALENCPVDGGIQTEDGCASSRESLEGLLKKLELVEAQPTTRLNLGNEEVKGLSALIGFALDYCPIEGGMILDDGVLVSRENLKTLREKLATFPGIAQE